MRSRLKFILIISVIKSYFGDITVNPEASGDTFIANYTCQFYDVVATSNQMNVYVAIFEKMAP